MGESSGDIEEGWYRQKDGRERYWDGTKWTDRYRDGDEPPPEPGDRATRNDEPVDEEPKQGKSSTWVLLGVAIVALVIFACCSGAFTDDDDPSSGAALTACRNAVKAQIKNPSTADFAVLDTTITDTSISGEVTAENDFGGEKTLRYRCTISGESVTNVTVNPL
ncbi:hypothetical protein [Janibacter terrae]|uniref:DUF2510 domain-containing protein n=1 Tax=Janibacter terrae TaxID=103817 RepID=UPI0031F84DEB